MLSVSVIAYCYVSDFNDEPSAHQTISKMETNVYIISRGINNQCHAGGSGLNFRPFFFFTFFLVGKSTSSYTWVHVIDSSKEGCRGDGPVEKANKGRDNLNFNESTIQVNHFRR